MSRESSSTSEPMFTRQTVVVRSRCTTQPTAGPARRTGTPTHRRRRSAFLVEVGADPNAVDKSGVAPLHRAVRGRCAAAVRALLDGGADPMLHNGNASTPIKLATHNTGKAAVVRAEAKAQQAEIIRLLELQG